MSVPGKCLCGAIEVSLSEAPDQIIACHCTSCQRATGGAASYNIIRPDDSAKLTKGSTKAFHETADSGNSLERQFCGDCGSPIYSVTTSYPGLKIWKAGLFADFDGMKVVTNIWCDSAPSWANIDETIPSHAKARQYRLIQVDAYFLLDDQLPRNIRST